MGSAQPLTSGDRASLKFDTSIATAVGIFILLSCMPTQFLMPLPKGVKRFACAVRTRHGRFSLDSHPDDQLTPADLPEVIRSAQHSHLGLGDIACIHLQVLLVQHRHRARLALAAAAGLGIPHKVLCIRLLPPLLLRAAATSALLEKNKVMPHRRQAPVAPSKGCMQAPCRTPKLLVHTASCGMHAAGRKGCHR